MAQETAQQKLAQQSAEKTAFAIMSTPTDAFGTPLIKITAAAAELVPTVQYGNATIGPVMVERWVPDQGDDALKAELKKTMQMVESAVAEDRQTLHEQLRAQAG